MNQQNSFILSGPIGGGGSVGASNADAIIMEPGEAIPANLIVHDLNTGKRWVHLDGGTAPDPITDAALEAAGFEEVVGPVGPEGPAGDSSVFTFTQGTLI